MSESKPAPPPAGLSRRDLVTRGLPTGALAIALGGRARAQSLSPGQTAPVGPLSSVGAQKRDPLLFLVNHATQGFTPEAYVEAQALGYDAYLERQLDPESIDDSALDALLANFSTLDMSAAELIAQYPPGWPRGWPRPVAP